MRIVAALLFAPVNRRFTGLIDGRRIQRIIIFTAAFALKAFLGRPASTSVPSTVKCSSERSFRLRAC